MRCSAKCSPSKILEKGLLNINGQEVPKSVKINAKCVDLDEVAITNFDYILEGKTQPLIATQSL